MNKVSERINRLAESATLAMARMSRELKVLGKDVIALSLGEPDFNTPEFIKDAAKNAINNNFSHYTPVAGLEELRISISEKFKRDNNLEYTKDQIVVSTGAKQSLANVCLSLLNPGDEVLLPCPFWVSYSEIIKLAEGIPVEIPSSVKNNFKITAGQIEEAITEKTKMFMFSSPCNPSGSVYTEAELRDIAKVFEKHPNIFIVSDEIYEHINFTGKHHSLAQFPEVKEQVVTVNGVSKAFAMTGWRLGYMGAPGWIAEACTKMQGQFTSGTCGITQRAAKTALEADPSVVHDMRDEFLSRRNLMLNRLKQISGVKINVPPGAFYVFPDISSYFGKSANGITVNTASDLSLYLLEFANVAIVTGDAFGDPDCIRISYAAAKDVLEKAMDRIEAALNQLA